MSLYKRKDSDKWWMWLEGAKPRSTGVQHTTGNPHQDRENQREALKHYHKAMADMHATRRGAEPAEPAPSEPSPLTINAFADWYAANVINKHRGRERELRIVAMLRRTFGPTRLTELTRQAIMEWRTERSAMVAPRTFEREIAVLRAMLKQAVALGHITLSPALGIPRLRFATPKRRLMTAVEERKLLAVATPHERAFLLVGRDGLVRQGDILDLAREDDKGDWLHIAAPKGTDDIQPYETPVSPRLRAALDALATDGPYYFARWRKGDDAVRCRRMVGVFERLCKRAGVPYGRTRNGLTFHWATRLTGTTDLIVHKRVDPKTAQAIGNWKKIDVVMGIYTQTNRDAMRRAVGQKPLTSGLRRRTTAKKRRKQVA